MKPEGRLQCLPIQNMEGSSHAMIKEIEVNVYSWIPGSFFQLGTDPEKVVAGILELQNSLAAAVSQTAKSHQSSTCKLGKLEILGFSLGVPRIANQS